MELRREAFAISDHVQLYNSCLAVAEMSGQNVLDQVDQVEETRS